VGPCDYRSRTMPPGSTGLPAGGPAQDRQKGTKGTTDLITRQIKDFLDPSPETLGPRGLWRRRPVGCRGRECGNSGGGTATKQKESTHKKAADASLANTPKKFRGRSSFCVKCASGGKKRKKTLDLGPNFFVFLSKGLGGPPPPSKGAIPQRAKTRSTFSQPGVAPPDPAGNCIMEIRGLWVCVVRPIDGPSKKLQEDKRDSVWPSTRCCDFSV